MDVDARLEALEVENQRLRDELDVLKGSQGLMFLAPLEFRLTGNEGRILGVLLTGGLKTKDTLMARLYRDTAKDEPEIKIIDVFICKLRKKIAPFGLGIGTRWGVGYEMSAAMIAKYHQDWDAPPSPDHVVRLTQENTALKQGRAA